MSGGRPAKMTSKKRCLAVLRGDAPDRTPVFPLLMGYAAKNAGITYKTYATDKTALAEAQLAAAERHGIDAVTACSDAFRVSADLGGEIVFPESKPPYLAKPLIASADDLKRFGPLDAARRGTRCFERAESVKMMASSGSERLVLGWVDFPFAEACSACGLTGFMLMIATEPESAEAILEFLTVAVIDFALYQLEAGADMIGCGDAAASLISPAMFARFALPYEKRVAEAVRQRGGLVKTHICGNTSDKLELIAQNGSDLYNVDHMVDLRSAAAVYGAHGKAVKGNADPVADIFLSSPDAARNAALRCIGEAGRAKYFLSAGCEIPPDTPVDVLEAFCKAAS